MARKKTVLLMTVGTGIGNSENLAHGIFFSIESHNPDELFFFGSEDSKKTISHIHDDILKEYGGYKFIQLDHVDDFKEYFNAIKSKIFEFNDEKVIIDYTSGTKTMTMAAAFASMIYHKGLVFVSGEREKGIVKSGTEKISSQNLYPVYDDLMIEKVRDLFNSNRFEAGKMLLDDIIGSENKQLYEKLFDIYYNFDSINYETALKLFDGDFLNDLHAKWPDLSQEFSNNRKALSNMKKLDPDKIDLGKKPWKNKKYRKRCYYILASLINNAKRRFGEGKYDDAIARLYRSFELIAQIRLREKYDINTSNVDLEVLKNRGLTEDYLNNLALSKSDLDNTIKIGLIKSYILLKKLDDPLGIFYMNHKQEIDKCTSFRNKSILAHGLNYQTEKNYEDFEKLVIDAADILTNNLKILLNQTKFPSI